MLSINLQLLLLHSFCWNFFYRFLGYGRCSVRNQSLDPSLDICSIVLSDCEVYLFLLLFVLFIYFPTIWWSRGGTEQVVWVWKRYLTIVPVQATITATRLAIEKEPRLRLIRRGRGFDQYADQYQKISGWTQWTRQLFLLAESGVKSAGKHPIAGLWRPDASSHAGGHWFESSSLHQILGNQVFPRISLSRNPKT